MLKFFISVISALCTFSIAHGILLFLATKGIYPQQWIAKTIGVAENAVIANQAITYILLGLAGLLGLAIGPAIYRWGCKKFSVGDQTSKIIENPTQQELSPVDNKEPEYIPLSEAARSLYEDLRKFDKNHWQVTAAESFGSPEKILNYFAIHISNNADIFGKRRPSTILEKIDCDEFKRGMHQISGNQLTCYGEQSPQYTELVVKSEKIPRILEWLKTTTIPEIKPDINMAEAIDHVVMSLYPNSDPNNIDYSNEYKHTPEEITKKLRTGELKSWGKRIEAMPNGEYKTHTTNNDIPFTKEDWVYRNLIPMSATIPREDKPQTESIGSGEDHIQLTRLRVNKSQVKYLWPLVNT